jgi:hypothetical protein
MARNIEAALGNIEPKRVICIFRIEIACLLEIGLRLGKCTAVEISESSAEIGRWIFRIEDDGLAVVAYGVAVVLLVVICGAAVAEGFCILRIEFYRLIVVLDGAVVVVFAPIFDAPIVIKNCNIAGLVTFRFDCATAS